MTEASNLGRQMADAIRAHEKRSGQSWRENTSRAEMLKGAPERRFTLSGLEIREASADSLTFDGYAAVWDQRYEVMDWMGSFTEIVERGALKRTLSRTPNVVLNVNHGGLPLARTTSGTLNLSTDSHGYKVSAELDARDPDVAAIRYKLERGDLTDMSWAFRVTVDEWDHSEDGLSDVRTIKEVNIDGGDVSIVTNGANPGTTAGPLRMALDAFADYDRALVECREGGIDGAQLREMRDNLDNLIREVSPPQRKTLSIRAAERALLLD